MESLIVEELLWLGMEGQPQWVMTRTGGRGFGMDGRTRKKRELGQTLFSLPVLLGTILAGLGPRFCVSPKPLICVTLCVLVIIFNPGSSPRRQVLFAVSTL